MTLTDSFDNNYSTFWDKTEAIGNTQHLVLITIWPPCSTATGKSRKLTGVKLPVLVRGCTEDEIAILRDGHLRWMSEPSPTDSQSFTGGDLYHGLRKLHWLPTDPSKMANFHSALAGESVELGEMTVTDDATDLKGSALFKRRCALFGLDIERQDQIQFPSPGSITNTTASASL